MGAQGQRMLAWFGGIAQPVLRAWQRIPLRRQAQIQIVLPLLAVACSTMIAIYGNAQRARIEAAMERHIETVNATNQVLTLMVNAETGVRGYLLTRRNEFLEPYATASGQLPAVLAQLRALAESEPGDEPRASKLSQLSRLGGLIEQQMADLAWQRQHVATASDNDI